jgi:hypothetical protein
MRTSIIMLAAAGALASASAFSQEATADQFMHRGSQSAMTRDQYVANETAQLREMAAKGMQWNQLYARWDYVGAAPPPAPKPAMSREEFVAKEAAEKRNMAAKGFVWNQLYATYQFVGTSR